MELAELILDFTVITFILAFRWFRSKRWHSSPAPPPNSHDNTAFQDEASGLDAPHRFTVEAVVTTLPSYNSLEPCGPSKDGETGLEWGRGLFHNSVRWQSDQKLCTFSVGPFFLGCSASIIAEDCIVVNCFYYHMWILQSCKTLLLLGSPGMRVNLVFAKGRGQLGFLIVFTCALFFFSSATKMLLQFSSVVN